MAILISVGYMTVAGRELQTITGIVFIDKITNMVLVNGLNESRNPMA